MTLGDAYCRFSSGAGFGLRPCRANPVHSFVPNSSNSPAAFNFIVADDDGPGRRRVLPAPLRRLVEARVEQQQQHGRTADSRYVHGRVSRYVHARVAVRERPHVGPRGCVPRCKSCECNARVWHGATENGLPPESPCVPIRNFCAAVQVDSRTHVPACMGLKCLISLCTNPVSISCVL